MRSHRGGGDGSSWRTSRRHSREQWIGREHRILGPGEMLLVPKGEVHGTYNPFRERLVFLAILSPANAPEPGIVDVSTEEPWASLRQKLGLPDCA